MEEKFQEELLSLYILGGLLTFFSSSSLFLQSILSSVIGSEYDGNI